MKAMPDFFIKEFREFLVHKLSEECFSAGICDAGV